MYAETFFNRFRRQFTKPGITAVHMRRWHRGRISFLARLPDQLDSYVQQAVPQAQFVTDPQRSLANPLRDFGVDLTALNRSSHDFFVIGMFDGRCHNLIIRCGERPSIWKRGDTDQVAGHSSGIQKPLRKLRNLRGQAHRLQSVGLVRDESCYPFLAKSTMTSRRSSTPSIGMAL